MKILFLGDVVGLSGCTKITNDLLDQIQKNNIDFVIINAENADDTGVGLTKEICQNFFENGVDVITTGNHVWDQKDIMNFIDKENRLLRPKIYLNLLLVEDLRFINQKKITRWEF